MKKLFFLLLLCFLFISCENQDGPGTVIPDGPAKEEEKYTPTDTILSFSDENASKVITESTYNINDYTQNAGSDIKPYQLFSDGMCLQRDAINRIWGKASKTSFIAIEIKGKVYYGTVNGREWEIYLPKMNAGGPYDLTIISELGRIKIKDVYIGEVYFLGKPPIQNGIFGV